MNSFALVLFAQSAWRQTAVRVLESFLCRQLHSPLLSLSIWLRFQPADDIVVPFSESITFGLRSSDSRTVQQKVES